MIIDKYSLTDKVIKANLLDDLAKNTGKTFRDVDNQMFDNQYPIKDIKIAQQALDEYGKKRALKQADDYGLDGCNYESSDPSSVASFVYKINYENMLEDMLKQNNLKWDDKIKG